MPYCLISLGSNLGNRLTLLSEGALRLSQHPEIKNFRASRLFTTPPIGGPGGQEPFLNAVAAFQTDASVREVLNWLQQIETELGRTRKIRWDARSIDLDVVLYGDLTGGGSDLIVPHPRYTARMFVLKPACDVVPEWKDPRFGWSIRRMVDHLQAAPPSLALVGGDLETRNRICNRVAEKLQIQSLPASALSEPAPAEEDLPNAVFAPTPGSLQTTNWSLADLNRADEGWDAPSDRPWIAASLPKLPSRQELPADEPERTWRPDWPRLVVRLQQTAAAHRWPAPHQIWPTGGDWPEYRLEIDDEDWAVQELVSAFASLQCTIEPATNDGNWFRET